jgi:hypothetical protein
MSNICFCHIFTPKPVQGAVVLMKTTNISFNFLAANIGSQYSVLTFPNRLKSCARYQCYPKFCWKGYKRDSMVPNSSVVRAIPPNADSRPATARVWLEPALVWDMCKGLAKRIPHQTYCYTYRSTNPLGFNSILSLSGKLISTHGNPEKQTATELMKSIYSA